MRRERREFFPYETGKGSLISSSEAETGLPHLELMRGKILDFWRELKKKELWIMISRLLSLFQLLEPLAGFMILVEI